LKKKVEISVFMDGGILLGKYVCKTLDQMGEVLDRAQKHRLVRVVQVVVIDGGPEDLGTFMKSQPFKITKFTYVKDEKYEWEMVSGSAFCPKGARQLFR
jgi:hypothetical protein